MALGALPGPGSAQAPPATHVWERYTNVRFAYSICYPSDLLIAQGEAFNADGQKLASADARAYALVFGSYNLEDKKPKAQVIKAAYRSALQEASEAGQKITHRSLASDRFVVRGIDAQGMTVFHETVLVDDILKTFEIHYPADRQDLGPVAAKMSGCFHTNLLTHY